MNIISNELGKRILREGTVSKNDFVLGSIYPEHSKTHDERTIEESENIEFQSLCVVYRNYNNEEYIIAEVTDKNRNSKYYILNCLDDWKNIKYKEIL